MRLSLSLLLFCLSIPLFGQSNFGLALGSDNTKFTGDTPDGISYEFKGGLSVFGFIDFQLADQIQLSLRPGFATGGANIVVGDTTEINNENPIFYPINDTYVNFAALFKLYNKEKIYAFVGPEIGYLLASEAEVNGQKVDLSEKLNELSLGLDIGFGLNFQMFKQPWAVEWQLNQMLTTLTEKEDIQNGVAPKIRTTRTRLALIYKFKKQ